MTSLAPPISVQLTPQQVAWLDGRRQRGDLSRSAALRLVLDELIQQEGSDTSPSATSERSRGVPTRTQLELPCPSPSITTEA
jgi:Arc/MetJ-type ribon-helix-helix transcriptional regulator